MKHAIELRPDLVAIRDGASKGSTQEDIVVALDQLLYEIDVDELSDLEHYLNEADFNATFGNGINPFKRVPF